MRSLHITRLNQVSIVLGIILIFVDFMLFKGRIFFVPLIGIAITIMWLPFWLNIFAHNRQQKELEERFPDFVRNFTGAIKSGMPAAQAVLQVSATDYGSLTKHVKKLSNQIEWAIPFHKAFINFGRSTKNPVIRRAIATMIQAEQAGGNIEDVLSSITESLIQIKKIKEQRKAGIHAQILQSYIIFFVFLGIMVLIQNLLVPYMLNFQSDASTGIAIGSTSAGSLEFDADISFASPSALLASVPKWAISLQGLFLMLALIQGLFAGLVLGKLAEGDMTSGAKHSLVMMTVAFLAITLSQGV